MKRLVLSFLFAACHTHDPGQIDTLIGGACTGNNQCDHTCYQGPDFPNGFCSLPCVSDRDCPADSVCITAQGGMCAYECPPFDCTRLGAGYTCQDKDHTGGGKVNVCIGG